MPNKEKFIAGHLFWVFWGIVGVTSNFDWGRGCPGKVFLGKEVVCSWRVLDTSFLSVGAGEV